MLIDGEAIWRARQSPRTAIPFRTTIGEYSMERWLARTRSKETIPYHFLIIILVY